MTSPRIGSSLALWNRSGLDLSSDEVLSQILDRGDISDWRGLYRLAATDARIRTRIKRLVLEVPTPLPRFWLAALASLGEPVDFDAPFPDYYTSTAV